MSRMNLFFKVLGFPIRLALAAIAVIPVVGLLCTLSDYHSEFGQLWDFAVGRKIRDAV